MTRRIGILEKKGLVTGWTFHVHGLGIALVDGLDPGSVGCHLDGYLRGRYCVVEAGCCNKAFFLLCWGFTTGACACLLGLAGESSVWWLFLDDCG